MKLASTVLLHWLAREAASAKQRGDRARFWQWRRAYLMAQAEAYKRGKDDKFNRR